MFTNEKSLYTILPSFEWCWHEYKLRLMFMIHLRHHSRRPECLAFRCNAYMCCPSKIVEEVRRESTNGYMFGYAESNDGAQSDAILKIAAGEHLLADVMWTTPSESQQIMVLGISTLIMIITIVLGGLIWRLESIVNGLQLRYWSWLHDAISIRAPGMKSVN